MQRGGWRKWGSEEEGVRERERESLGAEHQRNLERNDRNIEECGMD